MIDLYSWLTPNGEKIHVMLEETGLDYRAHPVNILRGDQFKPAFLKISPNNKIPAILDAKGPGGKPISLFESGAILIYLADKTGKFLARSGPKRYAALEWLMFQMANIGPIMGQAYHFRKYAPEKIPYGIARYSNEVKRLYGVLDGRLKKNRYLAGADYSIADMANWPWVRIYRGAGVDIKKFPNVKRWLDDVGARPAVKRGLKVLIEYEAEEKKPLDAKARAVLYGKRQMTRR
jgi:GST-like protein